MTNSPPDMQKSVGLSDEFNVFMGLYLGTWATLDMTTDWAIGHFLKIPHEQAHLITAGMTFGRKGRLLADLIGHSDHPKKAEILGAFNKLRGNKRDIFVHSHWWSDTKTIRFQERSTSGEFKVKQHSFTLREFIDHVTDFGDTGTKFYSALGVSYEDMQAFGAAAVSLSNRSKA